MKKRKWFYLIFSLFYISLLFADYSEGVAGQNVSVFSTWEGFEVDKCASIWLILRFINNKAVINFFPKGAQIKEGIPFDTPDARFRRYHNMSTFEYLLRYYKLNNPKLIYIGKIIHDIEVNIWEKKAMKETLMVQDTVNKIIHDSKDVNDIMKKSSLFFDSLYSKVKGVSP